MKTGLKILIIAVMAAVILALGLALMLECRIPMKSQFRTFFLSPMMVPVASVVLIWGKPLLRLFIEDDPAIVEQVLTYGYRFLIFMGSGLIALYMLFTYRSTLQGMGDTLLPMVSGIAEFIMRTGGVLSPSEVGTAIMETSGRLSVYPNSAHRPVCPEDLGLHTGYEGIPLTLVMDGQLEKHNLSLCGQKESWLLQHLAECGYEGLGDVLLCYLDTDGRLSVYGYEGKPPVPIAVLSEEEVVW